MVTKFCMGAILTKMKTSKIEIIHFIFWDRRINVFRDFRGCVASFEVLSRISGDGAHLVWLCPGFPGMGRIL